MYYTYCILLVEILEMLRYFYDAISPIYRLIELYFTISQYEIVLFENYHFDEAYITYCPVI